MVATAVDMVVDMVVTTGIDPLMEPLFRKTGSVANLFGYLVRFATCLGLEARVESYGDMIEAALMDACCEQPTRFFISGVAVAR